MGINYIASAGTGKTYTLTEEIVKMVLSGVSVKRIFATTFSKKAAGEIKNRVRERLKKSIAENLDELSRCQSLQKAIYELNQASIGTFHSLLFKILKNHPIESGVDESFTTLEDAEAQRFFATVFISWKTADQAIDPVYWEKLNELMNYDMIAKAYTELYTYRLTHYHIEVDLNREEGLFQVLEKKALLHLTELIDYKPYRDYYDFLIRSGLNNLVKLDLLEAQSRIQNKEAYLLKPSSNLFITRFSEKNVADSDLREEVKIRWKSLSGDSFYRESESQILEVLTDLKSQVLHYHATLLLSRFNGFMEEFDKEKRDKRFIDHDDMLLKALDLLKNHPAILARYQKKYDAVFVDEFQDTDSVQIEIIELLTADNPDKLTIFGDPKQCIYEWRNASIKNYIAFANKIKQKETLDVSYRSDPMLIAFFNTVFNASINYLNLEEGYLKPLKTKATYAEYDELPQPIEFFMARRDEYDCRVTEANILCEQIKRIVESGRFTYRDIAVLVDKRTYVSYYEQALREYQIPYIFYKNRDFFQKEEIRALYYLLKTILYPGDEVSLVAVLKTVFFYDEDMVYEARLRYGFDIRKEHDVPDIYQRLNQFHQDSQSLSTSQFLTKIIRELEIKERFAAFPDGVQKLQNIAKLQELADDREYPTLRLFFQFFESSLLLKESEGSCFGEKDDIVRMMTMHESKGLDFPIVIIPGLSNPHNQNLTGIFMVDGVCALKLVNDNNQTIIQNKEFEILSEQIKEKIMMEKRRLLYVAMTRAKKKLVLIGIEGKINKDGNYQKSNCYLNDLMPFVDRQFNTDVGVKESHETKRLSFSIQIQKKDGVLSPKSLYVPDYYADIDNKEELSHLEELKREEKAWTERHRLAVSGKRFVRVSDLVREEKRETTEDKQEREQPIPPLNSTLDDYALFGSLIHNTLAQIQRFIADGEYEVALTECLEALDIDIEHREKLRVRAKELLSRFVKSEIMTELRTASVMYPELPFVMHDKEHDRFIEGRIDLLYKKNGNWFLLDYKTDRISDESSIQKKLSQYALQARLYSQATEKLISQKPRFFFAFLNNGKLAEYRE